MIEIFIRKYGLKNSLVKELRFFWFISILECIVFSYSVLEEGLLFMDL